MKLQVITDVYIVYNNTLSKTYMTINEGIKAFNCSEQEFKSNHSWLLAKNDIWQQGLDENALNEFICIDGAAEDESSEGWWNYEDVKMFFKEIN